MSMTPKQAAEELLKIADDIEKDAAEATKFVCDKCNHTASLDTINARRHETAKTAGENVTVSEITVNDKIQCPACDGVMAYSENDESKAYYFDPEKTANEAAEEAGETSAEQATEEETGKELPKKPAKEASEPIDYDSLQRYMK